MKSHLAFNLGNLVFWMEIIQKLLIFIIYLAFIQAKNIGKKIFLKKLIEFFITEYVGEFDDIWLQTFKPWAYKSLGFSKYITRKIAYLESMPKSFESNTQLSTLELKDLNRDLIEKFYVLYKKYSLSKCGYYWNDFPKYLEFISFIKFQKGLRIVFSDNCYAIVNIKNKQVLDFVANNYKEAKAILSKFQGFWYYLVNQSNLENFFSKKINQPFIYSLKKPKKLNRIYINNIIYFDY